MSKLKILYLIEKLIKMKWDRRELTRKLKTKMIIRIVKNWAIRSRRLMNSDMNRNYLCVFL